MDDWGIPDWTDPQAYGDTAKWSFKRWRWEFFRRRDDLRAAFDTSAEQTYLDTSNSYPPWPDGSMAPVLRPDQPGFVTQCGLESMERFGYNGIPNPRIGDQPDHVIFPYHADGKISYLSGTVPDTFQDALDAAKVELNPLQDFILDSWKSRKGLRLEPHEVAIIFDLNRPLESQLKLAREWVRGLQVSLHGKTLQTRRHPKKWLGYLRCLDARTKLEADNQFSWQNLADALYSAGLLERHKDPAGGYCNPPGTAARDMWEAANALRFNF